MFYFSHAIYLQQKSLLFGMTSHYRDIKLSFLSFFSRKKHKILPSAPLLNAEDPKLLFINAGMNPFKDYFLGNRKPVASRVADVQRCLRVSGKHNDLNEVGQDTYHLTCFEMLGNWSFGDYFKAEAIAWAWEYVSALCLPADRLYATVFGGSPLLEADTESEAYWKAYLPADRILSFGSKENFWEMGASGPCGPCTELHIDLRSAAACRKQSAHELINKGHPEVIELWNLVFIGYASQADASLSPLPARHVDTGMGMERLCMVLQEKSSLYDTDIFAPVLGSLSALSGRDYGEHSEQDIAFRVIVDHVRALAFAMADGCLPASSRAGYVLRRLLRRALRYGHTFLGLREPFLARLLPAVVERHAWDFEALAAAQDKIAYLITQEEENFLMTLERGLKRLSFAIGRLPSGVPLEGAAAFELYDTYGFPVDLTELILDEQGRALDMPGFEQALLAQRNRSQHAAEEKIGDWIWCVAPDTPAGEFVGYDQLSCLTHLQRYRCLEDAQGVHYEWVLEKTPFYPEGGGQVGDQGTICCDEDNWSVVIYDTQRLHALIVHKSREAPPAGATEKPLRAVVDSGRRQACAANHTATHLLHAALRHLLGDHVEQRGSLVRPEGLRFDFSHGKRLSLEQMQGIEREVNEKIRENIPLGEERDVSLGEAKARGARALFGEKYGEHVRVITFDKRYSVELCGGTHVRATGAIGLFRLASERALAAGIRRIEAASGEVALSEVQAQQLNIEKLKDLLKQPKDLVKGLAHQLLELADLRAQLKLVENQAIERCLAKLGAQLRALGKVSILVEEVSLDAEGGLRTLCFRLAEQQEGLLAVLTTQNKKGAQVAVYFDRALSKQYNWRADGLCKELVQKHIDGRGGGQPFFCHGSRLCYSRVACLETSSP